MIAAQAAQTEKVVVVIRNIAGALLAVGLMCSSRPSQAADNYPNRPINLIVPFAPGADTDSSARFLAHDASDAMGQPWIVINKPGASGIIGTSYVAKAPADGYTLLLGSTSTQSINPFAFRDLPYRVNQFTPLGLILDSPKVLAVTPALPVKTLKDFANYLKTNPGKVNFGTAGTLTTTDMGRLLIEQETGGKTTPVAYKGTTEALTAIMNGEVQALFVEPVQAAEYVKTGKIRLISVLGPRRLPSIPDVPTSAEGGYPLIISDSWFGVFAPVDTPANIVTQLRDEIRKATNGDVIRQYVRRSGGDPDFAPHLTAPQLEAFFDDQVKRWGGLFHKLKIQPN